MKNALHLDRRTLLMGGAVLTTALALPVFAAAQPDLSIFELRQYTLKGGAREAFTLLFEQHFVTPQNEAGSHVRAVFRDLDDPDRFVWIRGFAGMEARKTALETFYFGPVWRAHRNEANAMIVDSDNVLLLKRLSGLIGSETGVVRISIHPLGGVDPASFAAFFEAHMRPRIEAAGGAVLATLVSETAVNNFPRLPVRDQSVFLWISQFRDEAAERAFTGKLVSGGGWRDGIAEALLPALMQKPEVLRLAPS